MTVDIYCLSFRNLSKAERMRQRFASVGLHLQIVESISATHPTLAPDIYDKQEAKKIGRWSDLAWSCMQGHLRILKQFLRSEAEVCIVVEDDVMIRRDFAQELPCVLANFHKWDLDLLMLGYLRPETIATTQSTMPLIGTAYTYHSYEFNVYGTQMYMIRRRHAQWAVDTFQDPVHRWKYLVDPLYGTANHADWTITKHGRRALIYPMLAIEEKGGGKGYRDDSQTHWHDLCHHSNYNPDVHI
jgi:GR25 family glycosyltransferase involved in LPS biosynthesis